jgi:hypothetical protein
MSKEAMTLALDALYYLPALSPAQNELQDDAIEALEEALAKQEQGEPVGEIECIDIDEDGQPSAWLKLYDNVKLGDLLYTTPQQRKPLTDEQLADAVDAWFKPDSNGNYPNWRERMRAAIEAAHGIKGGSMMTPTEWKEAQLEVPKIGCVNHDCGHCQPKREPLTIEQLREHWQVAKVLDMTDAEIDFADYVLIVGDVEALYGIKGEA